jgi:hypothetical protein
MALSREVEIILKANSTAVKAAYKTIADAAAASTDDAVKDTLSSYATKVGDNAAVILERVLNSKNFAAGLGDKLKKQVEEGAKGITEGIADALKLAKDGHDQAAGERLKGIREQMLAFEKMAGEEFQDAIKIGVKDAFSAENLKGAASGVADIFEKALNSVDVNDLGGFAKSLGGAAAKGLGALAKGQKAKETAALAAGDQAGATAAANMAVGLTGLAAAVTGAVAVFALFIAYAKAADEYQAKLNKTLLTGTGVADVMGVAYQEGGRSLLTLTETMGAARKAAVNTAVSFKMTTEETASALQELNSAGITYKTIIAGATSAADAQSKFELAISRTITSASMLGLSVSELSQYQNTLMKDVNMSFEHTYDVFDAISKASEASGMATKTFFTAISQATSGMALYNVRVGQAIGLIKDFSEIVGEADAGTVLGSFTEKDAPEKRLKKTELAVAAVGIEKIRDLFRNTTKAAVDEFQKNTEMIAVKVQGVFETQGQGALGKQLTSTNDAERAKGVEALADLAPQVRDAIQSALRGAGFDGDAAAARQFGSFAKSARGIKGEKDQIAGLLNQLDMASRIALVDYQAQKLSEESGKSLSQVMESGMLQTALTAFEVTEEQLAVLTDYRAKLAAAKKIQGKGTADDDASKAVLGGDFTVEGDSVKNKFGDEITDIADIIRGMGVGIESGADAQARQDANEKQRMSGTITAALEAWVQGSLFESALAPTGTLNQILKWVSKSEYDPEKMAKDEEARQKRVTDAQAKVEAATAAKEEALRTSGGAVTSEVTAATEAESVAKATLAGAGVAPRAGTSVVSSDFAAKYKENSASAGDAGKITSSVLDAAFKEYQDILDIFTVSRNLGVPELLSSEQQALALKTGIFKKGERGNLEDTGKYYEVRSAAKKAAESAAGTISGVPMQASPVLGGTTPFNLTAVDDAFISKDGSMYRGPSADNILMFKDGGPLDPRNGGGGGGVVININGGDQAMVYRTVARAMRAAQA